MNRNNHFLTLYRFFLEGNRYKESTIKYKLYTVKAFLKWTGSKDVRDITGDELTGYLVFLTDSSFSISTISHQTSTFRQYFSFLQRNDYLLTNPAEDLVYGFKETKKEKKIFCLDEMNLFLDSITINSPNGSRDRALFELMYSSGLRRSEAVRLEHEDIQLDSRILLIKDSKGSKDRYVPFSQAAKRFLLLYLKKGRKWYEKRLKNRADSAFLFLSLQGTRLTPHALNRQFKHYLEKCGLDKQGFSLHSIRYATATHLLEAGASIRYVQELLGHESIETTREYSRPTAESIKRIYRMFHPRENELYREVGGEYLAQLEKLKEQLIREKKKNAGSLKRR